MANSPVLLTDLKAGHCSGKKLGMGSGELMEVDLLLLDAKVGNVAGDQWKSMSYVVFLIHLCMQRDAIRQLYHCLSFHFSRKGNTNVDHKSEVR
ncbi:hypothetical protein YC2023_028497 [Brassica napus]